MARAPRAIEQLEERVHAHVQARPLLLPQTSRGNAWVKFATWKNSSTSKESAWRTAAVRENHAMARERSTRGPELGDLGPSTRRALPRPGEVALHDRPARAASPIRPPQVPVGGEAREGRDESLSIAGRHEQGVDARR